jgi:hypothetical protein
MTISVEELVSRNRRRPRQDIRDIAPSLRQAKVDDQGFMRIAGARPTIESLSRTVRRLEQRDPVGPEASRPTVDQAFANPDRRPTIDELYQELEARLRARRHQKER